MKDILFEEKHKLMAINERYFRDKRGLSAETLSSMINQHNRYIADFENGKAISEAALFAIAKALDVPEWILFYDLELIKPQLEKYFDD